MNPNRERIDDEVSVNEGGVAEFKKSLVRPPRRAKRDVIAAPVAVVLAVAWFGYVLGSAEAGVLPGGGIVLGGVCWAVAEVLPVRAVRPAIVLRLIGLVLFLATIASTLVAPFVDAE